MGLSYVTDTEFIKIFKFILQKNIIKVRLITVLFTASKILGILILVMSESQLLNHFILSDFCIFINDTVCWIFGIVFAVLLYASADGAGTYGACTNERRIISSY